MTVELSTLALSAAAAGAVAWLVTDLLVPVTIRVALALQAVDHPGDRRVHSTTTPRLGGVAVGIGMVIGAGAVALAMWGAWGGRVSRRELIVFALALALVFLLGLVDDLVGVGIGRKFAIQFAAAGMLVAVGWRFDVVTLPWGSAHMGWFGAVLALLWLVGVTNAVNLVDGLDGLAGGVVAIIALSVMVFAAMWQNLFTVVLMAAVAGACLGFLRHNLAGRVFLGDAGSLTLGFALAALSLHSSIKASATVAILVPLLALGVPVFDTLLVMADRFGRERTGSLRGRTESMFRADRNHLHHLLAAVSGSRRRVVRTMYLLVALSCALALLVAFRKSGLLALVVVGVEVVVVVAVRQLGLAARLRAARRGESADDFPPVVDEA